MEYKIKYKEYEFNITQNEDGSFNIPQEIKDIETFGTSMKPANEPICLARKPLSEKSIAENVLKWGTGGINIDGCRIGFNNEVDKENTLNAKYTTNRDNRQSEDWGTKQIGNVSKEEGRFPANIILECICDEVIKGEKGEVKKSGGGRENCELSHEWGYKNIVRTNFTDKGDIHTNPMCPCYMLDEQSSKASRFFYQAKVSKKERNLGLGEGEKSTHPTVKPIKLMAYLCRLITPKGGVILDPFMGSGSTGIAAKIEGFDFIGMEMDEDYVKIAEARIEASDEYKKLMK